MKRLCLVSLGELLWDLFPAGERLGGAAANVACHAASLGAESWLISGAGGDERGVKANEILVERGVETSGVQIVADRPTGTVTVKLYGALQPSFEIGPECAWDTLDSDKVPDGLANRAEVVCFGTLAQRSADTRAVIRSVLVQAKSAVRILDVNLREPFYDRDVIVESLKLATVLKLSDQELPRFSEWFDLGDTRGLEYVLRRLGEMFELEAVALTRGAHGALLVTEDACYSAASPATQVLDTVGAGDAFTATLAIGLGLQLPPGELLKHACAVAAWVCGQDSATPELPGAFRFEKVFS